MEEGEDCDSDSTVLLTDYVDKPEKIVIKRRRLSNVHVRGNQSEEDTAPDDISVKGTGSAPEKKSNVYKKWHLKKYLECNNFENQLDIDDKVPNNSITTQGSKGNSNNVDNDQIVSLDSDDETQIDLSSHQCRKGVEKSARNDRVDLPKPARLTNRRATTGITGRNEVDLNSVSGTGEKHAKIKRRATVHFEELLNNSNVNRKKGIPNTNTEREEERESDRRRSITTHLLQQSADVNTSNNSSAGCDRTGISVASLPTPRKPLETHIARLQATNTVSNVKRHKRIGSNNESQAEPKRIKMNKSTDLAQLIKNTASEVKNKSGAVNEKKASVDTIDANSKSTANRVKKHRASRDKQENTVVQGAEVIGGAHHKNAVNKALDKQIMSEVFDKKNAIQVRDDQGATKALDEFGTSSVHEHGNSELHDKQEINKIQHDFGTSKPQDEAHDEHELKNQSEVKINKTNDQHEIDKTLVETMSNQVQHKQVTSKILDNAEASQSSQKVEIYKVQDGHATSVLNNEPKTKKVQDNHETSKLLTSNKGNKSNTLNKQKTGNKIDMVIVNETNDKQDKDKIDYQLETNNVKYAQIPSDKEISEAGNNQEVSKVRENNVSVIQDKEDNQQINTEPKTTESRSVQETITENGTTSKASGDDGEDCDLILKFHVGFFTLVKENFKDRFPESAMELHNLIQTLISDTRNGQVQTDVKYCCPKCSRVSIYSSRIPNNEEKASADTKKCGFCKGIRKLHTCYLMRFLRKKYTNNDKKEVTKIVSPGKDHAIQREQSRDSLIGGIVISESQTTSEATAVIKAASLVAERDSTCSSIADNNKQVRNLTVTQSNWKENTANYDTANKYQPNETRSQKYFQHAVDRIISPVASGTIKLIDKEVSDQDTPITTDNKISAPSKGDDMNDEASKKTDPAINNKRKSEGAQKETTEHKLVKTGTEQNNAQGVKNLTPNVTETNNQRTDKLANKRPNKVQIINIQNITSPRTERPGTSSLESDPSNDTRINRTEGSDHCNTNTPEKPSIESTNKFQIEITQKVCLKPKINSDNIITTAVKGITSESMLNKKRQLEANENDKEKKIASNNTPTGSIPETDEANAKKITDDKRNDQDNEGVIKPLMDCFTKIKNNLKQKEEIPIIAQEEKNNVSLGSSTSNIQSPIRGGSNDSRDNFQHRDVIKIVNKFICPICSTVHAHASRFLRHMNDDHDRNLTAVPRNCVRRLCPFCNILVLKNYNSHVKRTHPERFTENFNIAENTNKIKPEKQCSIKNDIFLNRGNTGSNTISESTRSGDDCITPDKKLAHNATTQHDNRDDPPTTTSTSEITSENDTKRCEASDKSSALKTAATSCNKEKRAPSDCNDDNLDTIEHSDESSLHNKNMHNINETCHASDKSKPTKANTREENINNRKDDGDHSSAGNDEYNGSKSSNNHGIDNDIPKLREETLTASCIIENGKQHSPEPSFRYKSNDKQSTENKDKSQTDGSIIYKEKEPDSEEECIKASDNTIKKRKKRIPKLFGDENDASESNKIIESKSNEDARSEHSSELPSRQKKRQTPKDRNTETERPRDKQKAVHKRRQATVEQYTESAESSDSDWVIRNDVSSDSYDELCPINQKVVKKLLITKNKNGSNQSTETDENNDDSDDGTIKSSKYAVKKRKERLSKLFGDDYESSVSDKISGKDNREASSEKNGYSDQQRAEVEENETSTQNVRNKESCYTETRNMQNVSELLTKHQEGNNQSTANDNNDGSDDETIKTSIYAVEERLAKLFGDDNETSLSDEISEKDNREVSSENIHSDRQSAGIEDNEPSTQNGKNEESCYPETRNMQNVSELLTKHQEGNNQYTSDDHNDDRDNGTIKTSQYAVEERLSMLFGDDIETSVSNKISEKDDREASSEKKGLSDRQSAGIKEGSKESVSVNCGQEVPSYDETQTITHTFKKRMDRISKHHADNEAVVQNSDSNQERANIGINNASRLPILDDVRMEVNVSEEFVTETVEIPDKSNNENCVNEAEQETSRKNINTDCDIHRSTDRTDITAVAEKEINAVNTENKSRDDEIEIIMIDRLLKIFDDNQKDASAEKENDDDNRMSQVSGESQAITESVQTCLENIRITNVISVQGKTHVFICQECNYATDVYDDAIRHCQHHYNLIEDQVTYCAICQIHYDTMCFERHQASHDKYLRINKIKFSYKWLFTNWQVVFENKEISLSESEYMQVKSIYKTLCVKMTVKEDGPWQSAVYLCAKCNTCVPALDVEKHVQLKCTFVHYPCHVCDRVFSTNELREHHEIYHADESKLFKTVVFNGPNDESINAKLIQVKARSKENKGTVDIFKCLCGLCFVSLKNFKLHFTDCDSETSGGNICPRCTTIRRFSTTELEEHLLRHHFLVNCEFRVQKIMFQLESIIDSSEETPAETSNGNATHKWNVDDLNIKRDMLKDESLTQTDGGNRRENLDNVEEFNRDQINERMPETSDSTDNAAQTWSNEDLIIKKDMLKEESLTQSTDGEDRRENIVNVNEDIKREQIDETIKKTSDSTNNAAQRRTSNEDSIIKNVMLKETLTQNTNEANRQEITTGKEGIRNKGTQENKEIDGSKRADTNVSQEDMEVGQPVQSINTDSQEVMEVEPPVEAINSDSQDQTDNPETKASKEMKVEPEQLITVEDSEDDDDVEFIGESFPNTKIVPFRLYLRK